MESDGWRSTCHSTLDRMSYALERGLFSDVSFSVGSKGEVIRGHRLILSIGSPIFHAMLTEKSFDEEHICIPELEPSGLKPLLKYLYTNEVTDIPDEDYMEFFKAVKFFKVEELIEVGRKNILENLGLGNALNVFVNGKLLDEKELEEAADEFIKKNAEPILAQPKFSELSAENLLHFISSDDFSAPEVPICRAVHKWGDAECERQHLEKCPENLRLVLKKMVPQIRFPLMNSGDFALEIAKLNVLTLEETVAIHNYFFARHHQRHQIPEDGRFISRPRKYINYENEDKVDKVVWSWIGGINTGLRTDAAYTISNKGVSSANYLTASAYPQSPNYGMVDLASYEFGGLDFLSTFWGIRRGSESNTYTLFSKYGNGYLTCVNFKPTLVINPGEGKKPFGNQNLTFEPSKKVPGYFMITTALKPKSYLDLALSCEDLIEDGFFYAKFIEKPKEEDDSILWAIQKIKI